MGLLDNIKHKVADLNKGKEGSSGTTVEQTKESVSSTTETTKDGASEAAEQTKTSTHKYVDKIEGYAGEERVDALKSKVGEGNYKKGEDYLEKELDSRFNKN